MSFRRRNEPLSGPRGIPGSVPTTPISRAPLDRNPLNSRGPIATGGLGTRIGPRASSNTKKTDVEAPKKESLGPDSESKTSLLGVRPSSVTSQPVVSTGCADLDKILVHQGLPLSNSLLVEESGTTDFASVLVRGFAAQGVMHNRADKSQQACHVIVVGPPSVWAKDLPGVYKGSSKEQKKAKIASDSSSVSVANMAEKDLKIAWRYGLNSNQKKVDENETLPDSGSEHYITQFDITQRLVPGASAQDITFVPMATDHVVVLGQISKIAEFHAKQNKVVRIAIPGFLNPSIYPPQCSRPTFAIPFVHGLRGLLSTMSSVVLIMSLALDLYPRNGLLTNMIETLVDGVVHLQPFNPDMAALIERAYKNEPAKIQQGLVNIYKVPVLSDRGMMMMAHGEYSFKNGRKKFEIDAWGIPVEDAEEPSQTSQNIDF